MAEPEEIDVHIQYILKEKFEGKIKFPEFESFKKIILFKELNIIEKTPNNLFNIFINKNLINNFNDNDNNNL